MREQEPVLVNARLSVIGRLPNAATPAPTPAGTADARRRRVWLAHGWTDLDVFDFTTLAPDQTLAGPALVESETTTILLRPGDAARFDARGWLTIEVA
jgi:N-methylhydantoinase A